MGLQAEARRSGKRDRSGKRHALVPLLLLVGACHQHAGAGPSAETQYLEQQVLPRLVNWWLRSDSDVLPLRELLGGRGYDELCILPEESLVSKIETPERPIRTHYSSFGTFVREGNAALIAVKDGEAHSILVSKGSVTIASREKDHCSSASLGKVIITTYPNTKYTSAVVGE